MNAYETYCIVVCVKVEMHVALKTMFHSDADLMGFGFTSYLSLLTHVHICAQTEGELSSLKDGRVPVVSAGGSPVFLPLSREDQGGQMSPHLPVIILEPSGLVHPPLLTGEH